MNPCLPALMVGRTISTGSTTPLASAPSQKPWIDENRPAWRLSYEETVVGTLNQYLFAEIW